MKRWGLIGLMALAGCAPEADGYKEAQEHICPGVTAGELQAAEPASLSTPRPEDGREAVFIHYRGDGVSAASRVQQLGVRVTATYRSVSAVAARVTPAERLALSRDPMVEAIEPDSELRALGPATLPVLGLAARTAQGSFQDESSDGLRTVQANLVWDKNQDGLPDAESFSQDRANRTVSSGAGVRVCIIDSGLDLAHPEFQGAVVAARDFLDGDGEPLDQDRNGRWGSGHGTHVAGIIGARAGVGGSGGNVLTQGGLVGVAPGAELVIARVLDVNGRTQMSTVLEALEYCGQQEAKVISLSLGGGLATRTSLQAFRAAKERGALVVAAAGNDGSQLVSYPASDPSVLSVGAVDGQERRAYFSNGGVGLHLMAPGVDVLSTYPVGQGAFTELQVGSESGRLLSRPLLHAPMNGVGGTLVDCGTGESLASCVNSTCSGFVAYVRPSRIPVEQAMVNVMRQGARAVVFGNEFSEDDIAIYALPREGHWAPAITVNRAGSQVLGRRLDYNVTLIVTKADYAYMSGTSMATPYVSGVAALLFSAWPGASPEQVKTAMMETARDLGGAEDFGAGLVQAQSAMEKLTELMRNP